MQPQPKLDGRLRRQIEVRLDELVHDDNWFADIDFYNRIQRVLEEFGMVCEQVAIPIPPRHSGQWGLCYAVRFGDKGSITLLYENLILAWIGDRRKVTKVEVTRAA